MCKTIPIITFDFILGAEPSEGFNFNIAMHGDIEEEIEGTELAAEFTFSSLQKFGQEFLMKLRGKKLPNNLLKKVNNTKFVIVQRCSGSHLRINKALSSNKLAL